MALTGLHADGIMITARCGVGPRPSRVLYCHPSARSPIWALNLLVQAEVISGGCCGRLRVWGCWGTLDCSINRITPAQQSGRTLLGPDRMEGMSCKMTLVRGERGGGGGGQGGGAGGVWHYLLFAILLHCVLRPPMATDLQVEAAGGGSSSPAAG